jgi:chorismate synthase
MAGNSFGQAFKVTTAGESHGPGQVVIIDGVPAGLKLEPSDLEVDLARRRPGQSTLTSSRREPDRAEILSGVHEGFTTGTSLAIVFRNVDARSKDYSELEHKYRPGHADFSYDAKYSLRDHRGGGRASARETVSRVAAGAVAKKVLRCHGVDVLAYVRQVGSLRASIADPSSITLEQVEASPVRCPDPKMAKAMQELIEEVRKEGDSIGGVAEVVARGVPAGWGEPVFDKLKADLGKALFSLPAVLGVEYGAGFAVAEARGSDNNDAFIAGGDGGIATISNRHGGMLGGISTGMPLILRCALKPTSSIPREQQTVTDQGEPTTLKTGGRHDPCLLPRFVPMAEAMVALTLADHCLRQVAQRGGLNPSARGRDPEHRFDP